MRADIIDAEVVEDFNVEDVFKPQVVHEVEVYAGPDDTAARTNLRQAGEIEKSAQWAKARLVACSVELSRGKRTDLAPQGAKLAGKSAAREMRVSDNTVRAYLNAWNAAAADGLCAPSTDLTPADGWTAEMPNPEDWAHYWGGNSHSAKPEPTVSERDWPVVPEPTPEELFQRLEKVRAQNIADGISNPPRTREDREADGRAFVESLIGNAKRQTEPATPERGNGENRHTDIINGTRNDLNLIAGNYTRYVKAISKEVPRENLPQRGNEYIIQYLKESLAKITAATEAAINKLEGERK